ncbi:Serine/threonine-protein kinase cbk1 [Colletotrichum truncatum]|uniref:Serine/threonine-protein kinase cbk1 n=1 Tax=Colletotrichum truncatum TaxID=5467 RepID=A0ACC3Z5E6_COLTU|nr:Serine/threonine-protein kinase cbk1 [Colletotrichum truncatum]KAF6795201.1 Serine/threonine-protein kinase cbk1 [Colletotrichum truncatum]
MHQFLHNRSSSTPLPGPLPAVMTIEPNDLFPNCYHEFDVPTSSSSGSTIQRAFQKVIGGWGQRFPRYLPAAGKAPGTQEADVVQLQSAFDLGRIQTIEKAAAAKIYLETYYNEVIGSCETPRERRVTEFQRLVDETIPSVESKDKDYYMGRFFQEESNHLRAQRVAKAQSCRTTRSSWATRTIHEQISEEPCKSYLNSLETLQILGKGSFGVVKLVRERRGPKVFAMKVIRKSDMIRSCQEGHLRAERDFLVAASNSNWVVPLMYSFQDSTNLYLVMDYMPGGDFLGLLIRENVLSEPRTRYYIAEMILCVEEAHKLGCIHRDVKPDNFLIGADGHLKISDFGLAFDDHWSHDTTYYKWHRQSLLSSNNIILNGDNEDLKALQDGSSQKRNTSQLGSSRHEPPPEFVQAGQLPRLASWSIGIILYECLYGHTPFLSDKGRHYTKQNIIGHKETLEFPAGSTVSENCLDLIVCLLQDKETRLSSPQYHYQDRQYRRGVSQPPRKYVFPDDASDIKKHAWFRGIRWSDLHLRKPEWLPRIHSFLDTHYFEEDEPISDWSESVDSCTAEEPTDIDGIVLELQSVGFKPEHINFFVEAIDKPYDSTRLKQIDHNIDAYSRLSSKGKQCMKEFVRRYGHKERKRPRDKLLRDPATKSEVMRLRKQMAFLGYSWRRAPTQRQPFNTIYNMDTYDVTSQGRMLGYKVGCVRVTIALPL